MQSIVLLISVVALVQGMEIPYDEPPAPEPPAPGMEEDRNEGNALNEDDFVLGAEMTAGSAAPQGISIESSIENGEHGQRLDNGLFEGDIMLTLQQREIVDRGI